MALKAPFVDLGVPGAELAKLGGAGGLLYPTAPPFVYSAPYCPEAPMLQVGGAMQIEAAGGRGDGGGGGAEWARGGLSGYVNRVAGRWESGRGYVNDGDTWQWKGGAWWVGHGVGVVM